MSTTTTSATSETSSATSITPTSSSIITTTSPTSTPPTTTTTPPTTTPTSTSFSSTTTTTISSQVTTSVPAQTTTAPQVTSSTATILTTSAPGTTPTAVTTVITSTLSSSTPTGTSASRTSSSSGTSTATPIGDGSNASDNGGSGGLSTGGKTAIAVVVPVVVVALLVIAGIFLWRRRRRQQAAAEARRKEVEDYGYNPNNDPTLPSVASDGGHEMAEESSSGYRGWGAAAMSSRKMSTTLSGGHTQGQLSGTGSDVGYGHPGGVSPNAAYGAPISASDAHSGDPLVQRDPRRETMSSDELGALGMSAGTGAGVRRGPSNASSTYSHVGAHSETSDFDRPDMPIGQAYDYSNPASYNGYAAGTAIGTANGGYGQHGPYGDGSYGGGGMQDGHGASGMPVVRDVDARRNTRIQQPGNYQQGNTGIAQNF